MQPELTSRSSPSSESNGLVLFTDAGSGISLESRRLRVSLGAFALVALSSLLLGDVWFVLSDGTRRLELGASGTSLRPIGPGF